MSRYILSCLVGGHTANVETQLHPTQRFWKHVDFLMEALGEEDIVGFEEDLGRTLVALKSYEWDSGDGGIKGHGGVGSDFSYPINTTFRLVFRRTTDRDSNHKPILIHLFLKTIEAVSP